MARPRLDESERRARTVGVRVTAAEAAELRERAQAARLSMGASLRRRALGLPCPAFYRQHKSGCARRNQPHECPCLV